MSEKKPDLSGLPTSLEQGLRHDRSPRCKRMRTLLVGLCLCALGMGGFVLRTVAPELAAPELSANVRDRLCPQAKPMTPAKHSAIWDKLVEKSATEEYKARAIEWLSGAVRVRYVLYPSLALNRILTICPELSRTTTWILWVWTPVGMLLGRSTIISWKLSPSCMCSCASESSY